MIPVSIKRGDGQTVSSHYLDTNQIARSKKRSSLLRRHLRRLLPRNDVCPGKEMEGLETSFLLGFMCKVLGKVKRRGGRRGRATTGGSEALTYSWVEFPLF